MYRLSRIISLILLMLCTGVTGSKAQSGNDAFDKERQRMLSDFQGFRKKVLDDYAKYLDGVWREFEAFKGIKRDPTPKPTVVPQAEPAPPAPVDIPQPDAPTQPEVPTAPMKPVTPPAVEPVLPPAPSVNMVDFTFYGMSWKAPAVEVQSVSGSDGAAFANAWRSYGDGGAKGALAQLKAITAAHGLNDWFTFQMVRLYADAVARNNSEAERITLQHYLLANMGYDVRLARTERQTLLLVPFKQMVYERTYIKINNQKYYLFFDNITGEQGMQNLYSCNLPADADCGKMLDLLFYRGLNASKDNTMERVLSDGKMTIRATVDRTQMEMLRHYPSMDVPEYAKARIMPQLHADVLQQVRQQIEGLTTAAAAQRIISFVQHAFDYATDGNQHGYEKSYFLEENFYYPKNDCEDRAIFYAYLVRNLLGLDVHLVHFPGHECTAVCFPDGSVGGDGYIYEGKRYVICDPTYIGAKLGECMTKYRNTKPEVELWY